VHLQDAVVTLNVRESVAHFDVVGVGPDVDAEVLLHLVLSARWVRVVAPRAGGVNHAGVVVLVEAFLRHHAIGVIEVLDVAEEELKVALCWGEVGGEGNRDYGVKLVMKCKVNTRLISSPAKVSMPPNHY